MALAACPIGELTDATPAEGLHPRSMNVLRRHAWWGLVVIAVVLAAFGLLDMQAGVAADPAIPLALTGMTLDELRAESPTVFRLFDFMTRVNGWSLVLLGVLLTAILVGPFRRGDRWAWWTMWALPVWAAAVPVFYLVAGVRPDVPPPPPMISGPIIAVLSAALLLLSRNRLAAE